MKLSKRTKKILHSALALLLVLSIAVPLVTSSVFAANELSIQEDTGTSADVTGASRKLLYNTNDVVNPDFDYSQYAADIPGNEFKLNKLINEEEIEKWINELKVAYNPNSAENVGSIGSIQYEPKSGSTLSAGAIVDTDGNEVYDRGSYYISTTAYGSGGFKEDLGENLDETKKYLVINDKNQLEISSTPMAWQIQSATDPVSNEIFIVSTAGTGDTTDDVALTANVGADNSNGAIWRSDAYYSKDSAAENEAAQKFSIYAGDKAYNLWIRSSLYDDTTKAGYLTVSAQSDGTVNFGLADYTDYYPSRWNFEPAGQSLDSPFPMVEYSWSSSDPSIADISSAGEVVIYQPGQVTFTCTASVDTGLTAADSADLGGLDTEKEFSVTYTFTEYKASAESDRLDNTEDALNFPAPEQPGSVTIDKTAGGEGTGYAQNGVAQVTLGVESLSDSEPIDVVLVIDVSRSMVDFHDYALVLCEGTRTQLNADGEAITDNDVNVNKEKIADVTFTGSRDITYVICRNDAAFADEFAAGTYETSLDCIEAGLDVPVRPVNNTNEIYCYCTKTTDGKYILYNKITGDDPSTTDVAETEYREVLAAAEELRDLVLAANETTYYAETKTASDEYLKNYDKIEAARLSASTFVNTLLDASPKSRIALVQFAHDDLNDTTGEYYKINSRVVCDYTSDRNELLSYISNEASDAENEFAQAGMGSGYDRYSPSETENQALAAALEAEHKGLTISNLGGTNYGLAFERAEEVVNADLDNPEANERQLVIFMTDGEPNTLNLNNATADSAIAGKDESLSSVGSREGWSFFALRRQLEAKLRMEELGYEIISIGFDLDSDGTNYFAPYEAGGTYTFDGSTATNDFETGLVQDLGFRAQNEGESDAEYRKQLLVAMRKKVVENIATYDKGYYAVEESTESNTVDYGTLNTAYEEIADSVFFHTTDANVTDIVGSDYELRLLPFTNGGSSENPRIVITAQDLSMSVKLDENDNEVTDANGEPVYESAVIPGSEKDIEIITFSGDSLEDGITYTSSLTDENGAPITGTITGEQYTIAGKYVTFTSVYDDSAADYVQTFSWNIGDIINQRFALSYDAYLTGSDPAYEQAMGRGDEKWMDGAGQMALAGEAADESLAVNESAVIDYTNYIGEYCTQTFAVPRLGWDTTSVTAAKVWDDSDYADRPASVTVQLQKSTDGTTYQDVLPPRTITGSGSVSWSDLPVYEDGQLITYKVTEVNVPGAYDAAVSGSQADGFTVTNTLQYCDVTVDYETTTGEELRNPTVSADPAKPYDDAVRGTQYDILDQNAGSVNYMPAMLEKTDGQTTTKYIISHIKEDSDAIAGVLNKDKEITFVYAPYEAPEIVKATEDTLIKITDETGATNYDITYTLTVNNPNSYPLTNLSVSDTLEAYLDYVSGSASNGGTCTGDVVTWAGLEVPAASGSNPGSITLSFSARISDAVGSYKLGDTAPYENRGCITGYKVDPTGSGIPTNVTAEIYSNQVETNVFKEPTIEKKVNGVYKNTASVDEPLTYTITVTNNGSTPLYNTVITDTIPEGMAFRAKGSGSAGNVTASIPSDYAAANPDSQPALSVSGRDVTVTVPCVAARGTITIELYVTIADGDPIRYRNTAYIRESYLDPSDTEKVVNNKPSNEVETVIVAEPFIEKTADKEAACKGDVLTYTITVFNPTAHNMTQVTVTDTLPEGLTCTDSHYNSQTNQLSWTIPTIASGKSQTVTFEATVADTDTFNAATGTYDPYHNVAELTGALMDTDGNGTPEQYTYTDKKASADTVPLNDPVISKTDDKEYVYEGDTITYTLTVTNPNSYPLLNVEVSDPVPDGLICSGCTYPEGHTVEIADGGAADDDNIDVTLRWTIPSIAANGSATLVFTAEVDDRSQAVYRNIGYINSAVIDLDRDGTENTGDITRVYNNDPNSETDDNKSAIVEADVYYNVTVEFREYDTEEALNHGQEIQNSVTQSGYEIDDPYDVTAKIPDIIRTDSGKIWILKEISENADPKQGDVTGDMTVVALYEEYSGQVIINKQVSTDRTNWADSVTVYPDTQVWFRIIVENLGEYSLSGLTLSDVLKYNDVPFATPDSWEDIIDGFHAEDLEAAGSEGSIWTSEPMLWTADGEGGDAYINTAILTNTDSSTIQDSAVVNIVAPGSISITKSAALNEENGVKYASPGRVRFTLTVTNDGDSPLTNVVVKDDSFDVYVIGENNEETFAAKGTPIKTISSLEAGGTDTIIVEIVVPPETSYNGKEITNQATATGTDQLGNEVSDSDDDTVILTDARLALAIVKQVNGVDASETPLVVAPGTTLNYTVTVYNNTDVPVEDLYVVDFMDIAGVKLTEDWAISGGWTIDVPANGSYTFTAENTTVDHSAFSISMPNTEAGTVINNTAVLYESEEAYTDGQAPVAQDNAKVEAGGKYEIEVTKVADVSSVSPGESVGYVMYVTNKSNAPLTNITVTDSLSGTWAQLPAKTEGNADVTVTAGENNVLTISALEPGDCVRLLFDYTVSTTFIADTLTNTVTAEATAPDNTEVSDQAEAIISVFHNQLQIVKTSSRETAAGGDTVSFIVTVTNTGDSALANVVVTDDLAVTVLSEAAPASDGTLTLSDVPSAKELDKYGIDPEEYEPDTVIGFFETLGAGESRILTVEYDIPDDARTGDVIVNNAAAAADGGHEDSDEASVEITAEKVYDYKLAVAKQANVREADPGDTVTYTITVTNTGADDLTDVAITDSLPVVYQNNTVPAGQTIATFPTLAAGESKSITVSYTISSSTTAETLKNTATADSSQTEPVSADATVTVAQPKIDVGKTVNTQSITAGGKVYYTLVVTNTGNVTLTDLVVSDEKIGYSYTITSLAPGAKWTSPSGALYYTFNSNAAMGDSFTNDAVVYNQKVKGADSTSTTVNEPGNDYKGPATGDAASVQNEGRSIAVWNVLASSTVLCTVAAIYFIRRRRRTASR